MSITLRRLSIALALSVAVHLGFLLNGRLDTFSAPPKQADVIEARLVARAAPPKAVSAPAPSPIAKPTRPRQPTARISEDENRLPRAPSETTETTTSPASSPETASSDQPATQSAAAEPASPPDEAVPAATPVVAMPRRIEVEFAVARSSGGSGIARHVWERIGADRYRIESTLEATGIASLFMQGKYLQISEGLIGTRGLEPERYSVDRRNKRETARFNRDAKRMEFSSGQAPAELPPSAQDLLSFPFQFAFEPPQRKSLNLALTNGRKLGQYNYLILDEETLTTPVGSIATVHIFKLHEPDDDGLEMWLAPSLFYAPVKMLFVEKDGTRYELNITALRITSS